MKVLVEVEVDCYDYDGYDSELEYVSDSECEEKIEFVGTKIICKTMTVKDNLTFSQLQAAILLNASDNKYNKPKKVISWTKLDP